MARSAANRFAVLGGILGATAAFAALAYLLPTGLPHSLALMGAFGLGLIVAPFMALLALGEWMSPMGGEPQ